MIRLSDYENGQGRTDLRRVRYDKKDYVVLQAMKTTVSVVLAFLLMLGLLTLYHINYIFENALSLPLKQLFLFGGISLAVLCAVSIVLTCRIASREYGESRARAMEYELTLQELLDLYDKEEQGQEEAHS